MGEIRFIGTGETCGYAYPVCKKFLVKAQRTYKKHGTNVINI